VEQRGVHIAGNKGRGTPIAKHMNQSGRLTEGARLEWANASVGDSVSAETRSQGREVG
jgi:hypothetical protein